MYCTGSSGLLNEFHWSTKDFFVCVFGVDSRSPPSSEVTKELVDSELYPSSQPWQIQEVNVRFMPINLLYRLEDGFN